MHLQKISLVNFKNYEEANFEFSGGANCIVGNNGVGKTNLLDAIHYLCNCKSYFNPIDSQNILEGAGLFVIQGQFEKEHLPYTIFCGVKRNQKKQFKSNQKEYGRLADHIGQFPCVMISPTDNELITGGSEERRRLLDMIISQYDKVYLDNLITYTKVIQQRNILLKKFKETNSFDPFTLEIYNEQLAEPGKYIFENRKDFITRFAPLFRSIYHIISQNKEEVNVVYKSKLFDCSFEDGLAKNLDRDRAVEHTTFGIHKDDLEFEIKKQPAKKFASQGQLKSFLISLKLAQFRFIKDTTGITPILLLDDIYEKLDELRITELMKLVSGKNFGQIFITDSNQQRIEKLFAAINVEMKTFEL